MTSPGPTKEVSDWFAAFANFTYDPGSGLKSNFERLATQRGWGWKLRRKRWTVCQTNCFAALYGGVAEESKLEKWQDLCREVQIADSPKSITDCKKALGRRDVLVNLVNLIDHRSIGVAVIRFKNYRAFQAYTIDGCIYPRELAKEEGFIKALLRKL
ncbi:hypothetical protein DE146DRAFT_721985 [Phaeosphaeria sp. MPI-PUGE-AT-0046c]|nr:hypothetical protein DE146DRAFT_721985 [Phaeosphaeria sp. MPI-PUGE-AT-0046c]